MKLIYDPNDDRPTEEPAPASGDAARMFAAAVPWTVDGTASDGFELDHGDWDERQRPFLIECPDDAGDGIGDMERGGCVAGVPGGVRYALDRAILAELVDRANARLLADDRLAFALVMGVGRDCLLRDLVKRAVACDRTSIGRALRRLEASGAITYVGQRGKHARGGRLLDGEHVVQLNVLVRVGDDLVPALVHAPNSEQLERTHCGRTTSTSRPVTRANAGCSPRRVRGAIEWAVGRARCGVRNDTGLRLARLLAEIGLSEHQTGVALCEYAERVPGGGTTYSRREALATARSHYRWRRARDLIGTHVERAPSGRIPRSTSAQRDRIEAPTTRRARLQPSPSPTARRAILMGSYDHGSYTAGLPEDRRRELRGTPDPVVMTGSYRARLPVGATMVQTSVGSPSWLGRLPRLESARPFGIFGQDIAWEEYERRYRARLDRNWDALLRELAQLTRRHRHVVLGCFCQTPRECHRTVLGAVLGERLGLPVGEVPYVPADKPTQNPQLGLFGQLCRDSPSAGSVPAARTDVKEEA